VGVATAGDPHYSKWCLYDQPIRSVVAGSKAGSDHITGWLGCAVVGWTVIVHWAGFTTTMKRVASALGNTDRLRARIHSRNTATRPLTAALPVCCYSMSSAVL
jgi:hypothetical protein